MGIKPFSVVPISGMTQSGRILQAIFEGGQPDSSFNASGGMVPAYASVRGINPAR
jgi:hypothetical protein